MSVVNINKLIKLRKMLIFHIVLVFLEIKNISIENINNALPFDIKTSNLSAPYQLGGVIDNRNIAEMNI